MRVAEGSHPVISLEHPRPCFFGATAIFEQGFGGDDGVSATLRHEPYIPCRKALSREVPRGTLETMSKALPSSKVILFTQKFQVGDIVRMVGVEGPSMTVKEVSHVNMKHEYTHAVCVWFDTSLVLQEKDFPMTLLEKVPR